MTSTALLVMDVQESIVQRFAGDQGYLARLVFPRQAEVVLIADWAAGLGRATPAAG